MIIAFQDFASRRPLPDDWSEFADLSGDAGRAYGLAFRLNRSAGRRVIEVDPEFASLSADLHAFRLKGMSVDTIVLRTGLSREFVAGWLDAAGET